MSTPHDELQAPWVDPIVAEVRAAMFGLLGLTANVRVLGSDVSCRATSVYSPAQERYANS